MRIVKNLILGCIILGATALSVGQGITTGTVQGTVTDPSGAVVSGSQVQLKSDTTGLNLSTKSAGDGTFKFLAVPVGTYKLVISAQGFSNETVSNVTVQSGATTNLNTIALHIGTNEQIEVNGSTAALLETTDSQVTTTFDSKSMQSLPLNNGFDTLAEIIPGVVSTGGLSGDDFSNSNGDNYSVNGQSGRYNNFEIDGQSNNDNDIAGPQIFFGNQDAIAQLQIITNNYSAQYGRNAGAIENYITKSGTNQFHGSAFDLYEGQFLSSLTNSEKNPILGFCAPGQSPSTGCAAPVLPRYVENRAGATIGGPIWNSKLFFFFSTYWDRTRTGVTPSQSLPFLTPDATGLTTIQSVFSGNPGAAALLRYGPYSIKAGNPQPIPVPSSLFPSTDTCSSAGVCLEPITDASGKTAMVEEQGVTRSIALPANDQEELVRLDWQPEEKDHLFLRYYYQPTFGLTGGSNPIASGDWAAVPAVSHSVGADWTHSFNTRFVDQLRYSYQEAKVPFEAGSFPNCVLTNFGACPADMSFNGGSDDLSFGGDYLFPQGRVVKVTQIQNNATWTRGAQTLFFGGEFDYQNTPITGIFYYDGYSIYGTLSNLLGAPSAGLGGASSFAYLANGNIVVPFKEPDAAAYFQDDWKTFPTLTLHLGVRWEFFGQAVNELHNQTVTRESKASTAFWDTSLPLSDRTVNQVAQVYTNFEPRIGFAWNPAFDKKLVVSGGYAINANPSFYNIITLVADGAPVTNLGAFLCGANACVPSSGSILNADYRALNLASLPTGGDPGQDVEDTVPPNFRTPYVQTWTLGIQHQVGPAVVGEIRYVGSKTTDDFQSLDANPYLLPVATAFPNFYAGLSLCKDPNADSYGRPNCNYGNLAKTANGGWAKYNALELNLTTQNYHGLTSTVSYTFSKNIDNATDAFRSTGAGGSTIAFPQDPLNPGAGERGIGGNDFPNALGLGFTYDVPNFFKSEGFLKRVANGFQLSGVYRFRSGQAYTPYQPITLDANTGDSSFCDGAFNANVIGVDTCRLVLSNPKAPINTVAYLNPYVNSSNGPVPGTPKYVVYGSDGFDSNGNYLQGTAVNPASSHWIINNQAYAKSVNNPYPGSARSLLRGQAYSDLDLSVFKTFPINERVHIQLSMAAYNALNQMFLGPGNAFVGASNFTSNAENSSNSFSPATPSGNRFVILGGKVIF